MIPSSVSFAGGFPPGRPGVCGTRRDRPGPGALMTPQAPVPTTPGAEGVRRAAIARLRSALRPVAGTDRSLCSVAAERGIFCRGFRRWNAAEFDRQWRPAIGRSTHLSRGQMEQFADIWQLAEQLRQGVALACDATPGPSSPCRGWDEFSDEDLARFCRELDEPGRPG